VAAIKRSHHKIELDRKGKDSHRFQEAGANPSVITGLNMYGYVQSFETPPTLAELAGTVDKKADIILVEGFKHEQLNGMFRFVVISPNLADQELIDKADGLIVSDNQTMRDKRPFYQRDNVEGLVDWIITKFLSDRA
jgi:molybdopterin-guanine dinucleotide biosynthesis protein MobB